MALFPPAKLAHSALSARYHSYLCHCPSGTTFRATPCSVLAGPSSRRGRAVRLAVVVLIQNPNDPRFSISRLADLVPIRLSLMVGFASVPITMPDMCRYVKTAGAAGVVMSSTTFCDAAPDCAVDVSRKCELVPYKIFVVFGA